LWSQGYYNLVAFHVGAKRHADARSAIRSVHARRQRSSENHFHPLGVSHLVRLSRFQPPKEVPSHTALTQNRMPADQAPKFCLALHSSLCSSFGVQITLLFQIWIGTYRRNVT
jgi:hypothetical protein